MRWSVLTKEPVRVALEAIGISDTTLTSYTVEGAVVQAGTAPSNWVTASWANSTDPDYPAALIPVGPGTSIGALTAGLRYDIYTRVTGGALIAVTKAPGDLEAY